MALGLAPSTSSIAFSFPNVAARLNRRLPQPGICPHRINTRTISSCLIGSMDLSRRYLHSTLPDTVAGLSDSSYWVYNYKDAENGDRTVVREKGWARVRLGTTRMNVIYLGRGERKMV